MNGMTDGLRFGLIGCGGIGELRAQALANMSSMCLTAACDVDHIRAEALTKRFGGTAVRSNWRELVRRDDVDAVIVSTPPSLHAEMCIEALRSGKHVLCEKPLARSAEECRNMLRAAQESGRFLGTGFNYRFYSSIQNTRSLLDSGLIGDLDHVRAYTGYSASEHPFAWLHDASVVGGGTLRDNGIHLIDITRYFLGEVEEVRAFATNGVWGFNCEDNGMAILRSVTGRLASLHATWNEWRGYRFQIELYGTKGCIRTRIFPMWTEMRWSEERGGPVRKKQFFYPQTHLMEHLRSYKWIGVLSFVDEFREFAAAIRGAPSRMGTGFDGLRAIEIAEAAAMQLRSAAAR
jgi:predicted dehydrogenase